MALEQSPQKKKAQNQPQPRIKSIARKTKPKPKPSYERKATHPDYVQFRCNVNVFNNIITDVKDRLNDMQNEFLQKTHFWKLTELFYNGRVNMKHMIKSDLDLVKLLKQFDHATKSFKFGTKSFKITTDAVTEILGLLNEGKSAKLDNERYTSTFRIRHFGKAKPSKGLLKEEIHNAIVLTKKSLKQKPKTKTKKTTKKSKGHLAATPRIHTSFSRPGNITLLIDH